jgi:hypothetical protein
MYPLPHTPSWIVQGLYFQTQSGVLNYCGDENRRIIWAVPSYGLVQSCLSFVIEDGGSVFVRNVGRLPDHEVSSPSGPHPYTTAYFPCQHYSRFEAVSYHLWPLKTSTDAGDRHFKSVFLKLGSARGVRGSEKRKCVMAEEIYWRSKICIYECKWYIGFNYGVFKRYSLKNNFQ